MISSLFFAEHLQTSTVSYTHTARLPTSNRLLRPNKPPVLYKQCINGGTSYTPQRKTRTTRS